MANRFVWERCNVTRTLEIGIKVGKSIGTPPCDVYYSTEIQIQPRPGAWDDIVLVNPQKIEINSPDEVGDIEFPPNVYAGGSAGGGGELHEMTGTVSTFVYNATGVSYSYDGEHASVNGNNFSLPLSKGTFQSYVSSASNGQYPQDGVSGNVCLSKRSPSFPLKVHQDQPVQRVFLSITDRERFRHFDKAAA